MLSITAISEYLSDIFVKMGNIGIFMNNSGWLTCEESFA
jgi:hypothetical protein